jgi:hypothetical protein
MQEADLAEAGVRACPVPILTMTIPEIWTMTWYLLLLRMLLSEKQEVLDRVPGDHLHLTDHDPNAGVARLAVATRVIVVVR